MASPYRAIPQPQHSDDAMLATVQALKENVEILMGQRGTAGSVNQVFVGAQQPAPTGRIDGDLWAVRSAGNWVFKVWSNGQWT